MTRRISHNLKMELGNDLFLHILFTTGRSGQEKKTKKGTYCFSESLNFGQTQAYGLRRGYFGALKSSPPCPYTTGSGCLIQLEVKAGVRKLRLKKALIKCAQMNIWLLSMKFAL